MNRRLRGPLLVLWMCLANLAGAGSLSVNPVRVNLAAGQTTSVLTVRNEGPEPALVQLEMMRWSQPEGVDQVQPTRDVLASPPIFTLPAGGSQIVRLGLRGPLVDGPQELAYRLLIKEVPPVRTSPVQGVQIALNISLPVFVLPPAAAAAALPPVLRWQARPTADGLWLRADNDGHLHVQVTGLHLAGGERLPRFAAAYLLPGARREWKVSHTAAVGGALSLVADTDAGPLADQIVVTAP